MGKLKIPQDKYYVEPVVLKEPVFPLNSHQLMVLKNCARKKSYKTEAEVNRIIVQITKREGKQTLKPYFCWSCKHYHFGHSKY